MDDEALQLCELAVEYVNKEEISCQDLLFAFGKKQWQITKCLADNASHLIKIISKYAKARTKKIGFKALQGKLVLLQKEGALGKTANTLDLQLAGEIFPIIFKDYKPSLEFEVVKVQNQQQRELKSYVTTQLYNALYCKQLEQRKRVEQSPISMPRTFQSQLREYQKRTVLWMLQQERDVKMLPANYTVLQGADGTQIFKHDYCLQLYKYQDTVPRIPLPPGGILADEMGLGKTVELLATVLLNPRSNTCNTYWRKFFADAEDNVPLKKLRMRDEVHCLCMQKHRFHTNVQCVRCRLWQHNTCVNKINKSETYMCPNCWTEVSASSGKLVESTATIIVSPNAIKTQWKQEIGKHINSSCLKVLLYPGLHSGRWYSPLQLAQYDIVLTDYAILNHEIHHTSRNSTDRELRFEQRYMRPSSPLLMVNWWRVCLDEAQMVESSTSQVAEMVRQLPAINRWAVSGTPIQRSIHDLVPLLKFVGFQQACQPSDAWETVANSFLLNHKVSPLLDLLQHSMWRTCKSKVEHELGIPPQIEKVHRLELSNVESLYYREEHFKCTELFLNSIAKHTKHNPINNNSRLASISPNLLKTILQPFLLIRKTCSVPAVTNKNVSTTNYLNPQDLLAHLKASNELQCKTALRTWASSYNGIAAIYFIRKDYAQAINNYKHVLKLAKDYKEGSINVDSLLQIHALHNLLQAAELAPRTEELLEEQDLSSYRLNLNTLERKYLEDKITVLNASGTAYESKVKELDELEKEFNSTIVSLFAELVNTNQSLQPTLWNKILDEFFRQNIPGTKLQETSSMAGVVYVLHTWHDRLMKLHKHLRKEFSFLTNLLQQACGAVEKGAPLTGEVKYFIKNVSDCHLANILDKHADKTSARQIQKKKTHRCRLCSIRDIVNQFECLLFAKELNKDMAITDGSEHPSMEITLIRVVFVFMRSKTEFREWKAHCKNKLDTLDCLQNLVKLQIKYWIEMEYVIKAFDELDMCKMRILLTDRPDEQSNFRILPYQLDEQMEFNLTNIKESQLTFSRLVGRLKYLKHLQEDEGDKPCPICQTTDDERYVMLACGHILCQHCLYSMRKKFGRETSTRCPMCRFDSSQLYYSIRKTVNRSKVVGDFSTKISYIVDLVLKIKADCVEGEQAKILIFSQWGNILNLIAKALEHNNVQHRNKYTNRDIDEFKDPTNNVTCLLMPLARGAKGLNLIEATHVFLVEPILTPGEELQAIGRVHRFGQTKSTTVHRFIVNGTIEENILTLIKSADDSATLSTHWDLDNMSLESLKELFKLKDKQ